MILVFLNLSLFNVAFSYESITATLFESLDTLGEPEAKVFLIDYKTWICIIAYDFIVHILVLKLIDLLFFCRHQ